MTRYLRPTAFVDTPVGFDGQVLRLAGGMQFFAAVELIEIERGRDTSRLVPIDRLDAAIAGDAALGATLDRLTRPRPPLQLGERTVRLDQPQVMGILNVTPDSFSDGGTHLDAQAAGVAMAAAGAAIVDVGGESTRPGATTVWEGDEIARTQDVVRDLARAGVAVSIDTRKAAVMETALARGATLVNDVSALTYDARAIAVMSGAGCPIVIMHSPDSRATLHGAGNGGGTHADILVEVYDWLELRLEALEAAGIARSRLIVDPGIGFGKGVAENLALLNGLSLFHGLGCAILLGASRKRFIGALSNEAPSTERLGGSIAIAIKAAEQGAQLIRVHDVPETVQALHVWRGMRDRGLSG